MHTEDTDQADAHMAAVPEMSIDEVAYVDLLPTCLAEEAPLRNSVRPRRKRCRKAGASKRARGAASSAKHPLVHSAPWVPVSSCTAASCARLRAAHSVGRPVMPPPGRRKAGPRMGTKRAARVVSRARLAEHGAVSMGDDGRSSSGGHMDVEPQVPLEAESAARPPEDAAPQTEVDAAGELELQCVSGAQDEVQLPEAAGNAEGLRDDEQQHLAEQKCGAVAPLAVGEE